MVIEFCELNTDLEYLATLEASVEDEIKPDMKSLFQQEKYLWYSQSDTSNTTNAHQVYLNC